MRPPAERLCLTLCHMIFSMYYLTDELNAVLLSPRKVRFDSITQMFGVNICVIFYHALEHIHPILYLRWPFICFALLLRTRHLVQHVVMVQEILPVVSASSTQGIRRSLSSY